MAEETPKIDEPKIDEPKIDEPKNETPTPTQLGFYHQSMEPDHVAPNRRQADETRRDLVELPNVRKELAELRVRVEALEEANKQRGKRKYVLPCWVEEYLRRVVAVQERYPQYKNAAIEREIRERMNRGEDSRIPGLPAGTGLIKDARDMMAKADRTK